MGLTVMRAFVEGPNDADGLYTLDRRAQIWSHDPVTDHKAIATFRQVLFFPAAALATVGAGNIAATALLAPIAMRVAGRIGVSGFLMALMVANGANAGGLSPLAPTGIIARDLMARMGLAQTGWSNYANTFAAQTFVAFAGYFLFGGLKLFRADRPDVAAPHVSATESPDLMVEPLRPAQRLTSVISVESTSEDTFRSTLRSLESDGVAS